MPVTPFDEGYGGADALPPPTPQATPKKPRKRRTTATAARAPSFPAAPSTPDAFDYGADTFDASAFSSVESRALHQKLVEDRANRGKGGDIKLWDFEGYDEKGAYLRGNNKNLRARALTEIAVDKTRIMNEPPLSRDLKVFRGVNLDAVGEKNVLRQLQDGEFVERSFMSTSFSQKEAALWEYAPNSRWSDAARHVVFEIDVPKGSKGTIVGGIEEPELTFAPNARFEVIKIKDVKQIGLTNFQGDPIPGGNTTLVKLRYLGIDDPAPTPEDLRRISAAKAATKQMLENEGSQIDDGARTIGWKEGEVLYSDKSDNQKYSGEQTLFEILKTFEIDVLEKFVPGYKYRLDTAPTHTRRVFQEGVESLDPDFVPVSNTDSDIDNIKNLFHTNGDESLKQLKRGLFDENGKPKDLDIIREKSQTETGHFPAFYRSAQTDDIDKIEMDEIFVADSQNSRYAAVFRHEFGHFVDRSRLEAKGEGWRSEVETYEPLEAARKKYADGRGTSLIEDPTKSVFSYRSSAYIDEILRDREAWKNNNDLDNDLTDFDEVTGELKRRGAFVDGAAPDRSDQIAVIARLYDDDLEAAGHARVIEDLVEGSGLFDVMDNKKTYISGQKGMDLLTSLYNFRHAMMDKDAASLRRALRDFHFLVEAALPEDVENSFIATHFQFADFFGSMTNNKVGFGHNKLYFTQRPELTGKFKVYMDGGIQEPVSDLNTTEMFANYFAARIGSTKALRAQLAIMRRFAPETTKGFDHIIETRAKKMAGDSYTRPATATATEGDLPALDAPTTGPKRIDPIMDNYKIEEAADKLTTDFKQYFIDREFQYGGGGSNKTETLRISPERIDADIKEALDDTFGPDIEVRRAKLAQAVGPEDTRIYKGEDLEVILDEIIPSGKVKNALETGKGTFATRKKDIKERGIAEKRMFGITNPATPLKADIYPKYGFLYSKDLNPDTSNGMADGYGDIYIQFKQKIRERATFTLHDSLDGNSVDHPHKIAPPTFLNDPNPDALQATFSTFSNYNPKRGGFGWWRPDPEKGDDELFDRKGKIDKAKKFMETGKLVDLRDATDGRYAEVQMYGKVGLDDIEAMHVPAKMSDEQFALLRTRLDEAGYSRIQVVRIGDEVVLPNDLEAPTQGPKREYLKEFDDADAVTGVDISKESISKHKEIFPDSNIGHEEFAMRVLGVNSNTGSANWTIRMDDLPDGVVVQGNSNVVSRISRDFYDDGWVKHSVFELEKDAQGKGIAKKLMREAMDLYVDLDLQGITLEANITTGAYAWARYGFVPEQEDWDLVRMLVKERFDGYQIGDEAIPTDDAVRLQAILDNEDPKAIWQLADFETDGRKVGKELLLDDYDIPDPIDYDNLQGALAQRDEIHARMKDKDYEDQDLEGMLEEVESNIEDYQQGYLQNTE